MKKATYYTMAIIFGLGMLVSAPVVLDVLISTIEGKEYSAVFEEKLENLWFTGGLFTMCLCAFIWTLMDKEVTPEQVEIQTFLNK